MKHDWKQHIFSNVFDLQMGKTPDRKSPELFEGDNVWVTISDLDGVNISSSKEHISDEAASKIKIVKKGTVIMSFKLSVGKAAIASKDLYTNEAIMAFNVNDGYDINNKFLYYYLSGYNWEGGNRAVMGVTLNKATISKQIISLPPLSTQQSIVSELDSLSKIIADCKETLKDYDALEQSIFYDMFGDPVKNEKGFPLLKVDDVIEFQGGSQPDKKYFEYEPTDDNIRLIQIRDYKTDKYITYIPKHLARRVCSENDIMIGRYGPPIFQILRGISGAYNVALMKAVPKKGNLEFVRAFLKQKCLLAFLENFARRVAGQDGIQMDELKNYPFPYPPIELQNLFEQKNRSIEQMRLETKKALQEAETLFNARMDYWFN